MNKLILLCGIVLIGSGCQWWKDHLGSSEFRSASVAPNEWRTERLAVGEAVPVLAGDSAIVDTPSAPYLGRWYGEEHIVWNYSGFPVLNGVHSLELVVKPENYAWVKTDATEAVPGLILSYFKSKLDADFRNIEEEGTDLDRGELTTSGAVWSNTVDPKVYDLTLDIEDDPETYRVEFLNRNQFDFIFESSSQGERRITMHRI